MQLTTLCIADKAFCNSAPGEPCVIHVSLLLRELVRRVTALPVDYDEKGPDGMLVQLVLREIDWSPVEGMTLPLFHDPRLRLIDNAVSSNPGDTRTLEDWASICAVSSRTLARLFRKEGGTSFRIWRDRARALASLPKLAGGVSVAQIAAELGFETSSAFGAMFRRVTGVSPKQYARLSQSR